MVQISNLTTKQSVETLIIDGTCNSLPQGNYLFTWKDPDSHNTLGTKSAILDSEAQLSISLTNSPPISTLPKGWELFSNSLASILIFALPVLIFRYIFIFSISLYQRATLELFETKFINSQKQKVFSKSILIPPWGSKTNIKLGSETITIRINKQAKGIYRLEIFRPQQHSDSMEKIVDELSLEEDSRVNIGTDANGILEVSLRETNKKD